MIKKLLKVIAINLCMLVILLCISELILQGLKPYDLYIRTYPNQIDNRTFKSGQVKVNWMRKDTTLGWVCSASSYLKFTNEYYNSNKIEYKINKEGYRANFNFVNKISSSKKKIMLLGESFLFGVYLAYDQTLTGYLENKDSNFCYYNFGIPGYGIDQMFVTYKKYFKRINPDMILLVYIDDDIPRILESYRFTEGLNKPSFKMFSDGFGLRSYKEEGFALKILNSSYILNKFYQKYLDYAAVEFTKKILHHMKTEFNKEIIVVRWPRKEIQYWNKIDWYYDLSDFCTENGIHYLNLADLFVNFSTEKIKSFYLDFDGHPSDLGNKYVAEQLNLEIKELFHK